jgi:hypothetical protein
MKLDLDYYEQNHPDFLKGGKPKVGLLPGLTALTIIGVVGLLSVIPATASVFPGFTGTGFTWVEATGTVGGQADNLLVDICNIGAAVAQGLSPVCVMQLK